MDILHSSEIPHQFYVTLKELAKLTSDKGRSPFIVKKETLVDIIEEWEEEGKPEDELNEYLEKILGQMKTNYLFIE